MARNIVFGCFPLLLSGLGVLSIGCLATGAESAEDSDQGENAVVVSAVTDGDYVIRSAMTGKCLDISGSNTVDGGKVQEWDCNGTNAQKFHVTSTSGGYVKIINVNSNGCRHHFAWVSGSDLLSIGGRMNGQGPSS